MNWYCSRDALRERLGLTDTQRTDVNPALDRIIESVSRQIDAWCGRHFFVRAGTWTLTYPANRSRLGQMLLLPFDLVAVTSLKTDSAGDRTYAAEWATTDYDLWPADAPYQSPPAPYWGIARRAGGDYSFPTSAHGVQIVGKRGYSEVLERSTATVAEAVDTSETAIDVSSGAALEVGQTILVDSEQMFITAISTNTPTVIRGVNGTTAAAHNNAAAIDIYTYPVISESCLTQCQRRFEGTIGRPNRNETEQTLRAYARLDRDIVDAISLFKYQAVA